MLTGQSVLSDVGIDAVALKPTECSVDEATGLPIDTVAIDYEGRDALPDWETLESLAETVSLYVTTPVRAEGFDPLGDDTLVDELPARANRVLVAGHPAYLTEDERSRAVAPRLGAAVSATADPWVGTESIERIALAAGGTQYELLSRTTERDVRAMRAAGFDGDVAVYAPTVLTGDEDEILDAVGDYVSRRSPVQQALPEDAATDARAAGRAREVLLAAAGDYALAGRPDAVREGIDALRDAGVDTIVGYPARGIDDFRRTH